MKYLLLSALVVLTGCSTVPVTMKFPTVPAELTAECPDLEQTSADSKELSKTIEVVVKNYSKYHECSTKVEAWNEWYKTQKQIYESVK